MEIQRLEHDEDTASALNNSVCLSSMIAAVMTAAILARVHLLLEPALYQSAENEQISKRKGHH